MNIHVPAAAAWIILIQAAATYTAILSAFLLAGPILRTQILDAHREVLRNVSETTLEVADLFKEAKDYLDREAQSKRKLAFMQNKLGYALIIISFFLFTIAIILQIATDPAFTHK